jgi:hypothetical protein
VGGRPQEDEACHAPVAHQHVFHHDEVEDLAPRFDRPGGDRGYRFRRISGIISLDVGPGAHVEFVEDGLGVLLHDDVVEHHAPPHMPPPMPGRLSNTAAFLPARR